MAAMVGLLIVSAVGFGSVRQMFFPDSARPQLMVDFWFPEGTRIQDVSDQIKSAEKRLMSLEDELDSLEKRIRALESREDEEYQRWREHAHQRRYVAPSTERILDVEFVIE